jgi:hypothetical protein
MARWGMLSAMVQGDMKRLRVERTNERLEEEEEKTKMAK